MMAIKPRSRRDVMKLKESIFVTLQRQSAFDDIPAAVAPQLINGGPGPPALLTIAEPIITL